MMSSGQCVSSSNILDDLFGTATDDDSDAENESDLKTTNLSDPVSLTAVVGMAHVGGSRGLIAMKKIPPGVLILAEIPTITWESRILSEEDDLISTVEACISTSAAHAVTKTLHPTFLNSCNEGEIRRAEEFVGHKRVQEIAVKVGVTTDEVLRVLLALQHNGFGSGLYGVLTMLNHSCTPNCIKFSPSAGSSGASEIWTISQVDRGEELTICYCEPLEMNRASMQEYLEAHHNFQCKCPACEESIVVRNNLKHEEELSFQRICSQESNLEEIITSMEQELLFLRNLNDIDMGFENVVKLMKASTDLSSIEGEESSEDNSSMNPRLLARLSKLAANAAVLFLEYADQCTEQNRRPKEILIKSASFSFLRNSLLLLSNQMKYIGRYHPDVASSHLDIAEALACCIKHFPDDLLVALNAPVDEKYSELKLLRIPRNVIDTSDVSGPDKVAKVVVTKRIVIKESNRFRTEGGIIKNLYSRGRYPSRLTTLREGTPGLCHWGNFIPEENLTLLLDEITVTSEECL